MPEGEFCREGAGRRVSLEDAFIGLGSNLGDGKANLTAAALHLLDMCGGRLVGASSLYRTEPVGLKEQPWFLNGVLWVRTSMEGRELLKALLSIEELMGRQRTVPMGPRTIDLDLLLFGSNIIHEEGLCVPHPRMHQRRFVLEPLAEIAPKVVHPILGLTIQELLGALDREEEVIRIGPWEGLECS